LTEFRRGVIAFPLTIGRLAKKEAAMPRKRVTLLLVVAGALGGCATEAPVASVSFLPSAAAFQAPDVVQINVAILEVPVGDIYVNEKLWGLADEQQLTRVQKTVLHENGFRVGQIRGITPPGLQALLTSERTNPSPVFQQAHSGVACTIDVGPPLSSCRCQVRDNGRAVLVDSANAQMGIEVTPSIGEDGRVCLRFRPSIGRSASATKHGLPTDVPLWMLLTQRTARTFPDLTWDVSLEPNEYVVVGGLLERPETIGHRSFVRPEESNTVQRLLVIRTSHVLPEIPPDEPQDMAARAHSAPLALQAAWPAIGANGQ
jgi:hypothetical protein